MVPLASEPFTVDPQKAQMGKMMFGAIGCAACHIIPDGVKVMRQHKALAELNPDSPTGCLGDQIPKSVPNYRLSADQRAALKESLKNIKDLDKPLEPKQQAMHLAAAFNCFACHARDNAGGPTADRASLFVMSAEFDMGDEGRLPPALTGIGAKLNSAAIEQIIFEETKACTFGQCSPARMPTFHKEAAGAIVDALVHADDTARSKATRPGVRSDLRQGWPDAFRHARFGLRQLPWNQWR